MVFSLHLDKRHARWGVFLSVPASILYMQAQTHRASQRFCHESVLTWAGSKLQGTAARLEHLLSFSRPKLDVICGKGGKGQSLN